VAASANGEVWFDAIAREVRAGDRSIRGSLPIRVGVPVTHVSSLDGVDLGSNITARGSVLPPDPGDRAAVVLRVHAPIELRAPPPGALGALATLRAAFAGSAEGLPQPGGSLVPGLALGDTSTVSVELDGAMKASSLSHLTAVSGANCAIVVGAVFGLAALVGVRRSGRVVAGLVGLVVFVLLVTPEPSVVRAGAMAAVAMLAVALGRAGAGLASLCLAVAVLLAIDPWLATELGFALSAVATAALLVLARPLTDGLERFLPRPLALAVAVPLAAQLACAPLLVLIDPRVPLLGVLANMLAAPAAPVATIVGFVGCLAAPLSWLQDGLVAVAWLPASWIAGVAQTVAAVPGQAVPWMAGMPGMVLLAAVCAAVVVAVVPFAGGRAPRAVRIIAVGVVAATIGLGAGQAAVQTVASPWTVPAQWTVAMCDIGQGDAVLLRSEGATALVDTGPEPEPLAACLTRFGVSRIDLLVLTHFDLDHIGGVAAVAGRVGTVVHGPIDPEKGRRVLRTLSDGGAALIDVRAGSIGRLGGADWRVLWPTASERIPGNDASVALRVTGGGLPSMTLLGDLAAEPQIRLRTMVDESDIVKVAHHGSADQDPELYRRIDAELALVPVGAGNDYGHPRATLLGMLTAQGSTIARSDLDGDVAVWLDDGELRLWRERGVGGAG
jgi:competence protein ComEC